MAIYIVSDAHKVPEGRRERLGEKQRMVAAACCDRFRTSVEVCATCLSIDGPDRSRGRLDRRRERLGAPPGAQNSSFSPKSTPTRLSRAYPRKFLLKRELKATRAALRKARAARGGWLQSLQEQI